MMSSEGTFTDSTKHSDCLLGVRRKLEKHCEMAGNKISVRASDSDDDLGLKTMADSHQPINFEEALKPFYQRASEAEARLSKLEAALASKKDARNEEHLKTISNFQSKSENDNTEADKLATEFEKLKYVKQADAGEGEHLRTVRDLQSDLEDAKAEALSERKKAEELAAENEKHKYRIKHLIWALEEADQKLESMSDLIVSRFSFRSYKASDQASKNTDAKILIISND